MQPAGWLAWGMWGVWGWVLQREREGCTGVCVEGAKVPTCLLSLLG